MKAKVFYLFLMFGFGVFGGIFADQILWPYLIERPLFLKYRLNQPPVYITQKQEVTVLENIVLEQAVSKVAKTVIGVRARLTDGTIIQGSGLAVTNDGLIVTLSSLIPKGENMVFFVQGQSKSYQVLKRDWQTDLAVVKLEASDLPSVGFADFDQLRLGQRVFIIGYQQQGKIWKNLVNEGIIRELGENKIVTNIREQDYFAGSPVFDIKGEAIGLANTNQGGFLEVIPSFKIKLFLGL